MLHSQCNNKGIGLIEVIIAIFITTVAVLAIFSLQAPAWKTTARADYLGRAAEIMHRELESRELIIMNPCITPVATGVITDNDIIVSGMAASISGDATLHVKTTVTNVATNVWRVTVTVSWPPLNSVGITSSVLASPQEYFRFGC